MIASFDPSNNNSMMPPEPRVATEVDVEIGAAIRMRRTGLGLRQADVAEYVGVTTQQFQKYEAGVSRISAAALIRIAEVLGCDAQNLLPGSSKKRVIKAAAPDDVMWMQLQRAFARIRSKRERKMVLDLARRFGEAHAKTRAKR